MEHATLPLLEPIPIIPDIPSAHPRLGFEAYADALAGAIIGGNPPQFTIGIYGPWGSGKSTLLHAVFRRLKSSNDTIPVLFDAWRLEQRQIVIPLLHCIYDATSRNNRSIADQVKRVLAATVYSMQFKIGKIEFDASKLATKGGPVPALDDAFAKPFAELRKMPSVLDGRRIVVLIDDLDRCAPESVLEVLEAINVVTDVPGFVFVLALDYESLVNSVTTKFGHSRQTWEPFSADRFIEKIVQVPFRMPRLDLDRPQFLAELIPDWHKLVASLPSPFSEYAHDIATLGLDGNPRRIVRFINSFLVLFRIIDSSLVSDGGRLLAALVGLQLRWPQSYNALVTAAFEASEDPFEALSGVEDPLLARYREHFLTIAVPLPHLKKLLQLAESVAPEPARPPSRSPQEVRVIADQVSRELFDRMRGPSPASPQSGSASAGEPVSSGGSWEFFDEPGDSRLEVEPYPASGSTKNQSVTPLPHWTDPPDSREFGISDISPAATIEDKFSAWLALSNGSGWGSQLGGTQRVAATQHDRPSGNSDESADDDIVNSESDDTSPRRSRYVRCWCGSGKPFKACHGR